MIVNKLFKWLKKGWQGDVILDPTAYVLDVEVIKELARRAKYEKVVVAQADIGDVYMLDAMMHTWAYMNDVAAYNLRYGYIGHNDWQDMEECDQWLRDRNIYFQEPGCSEEEMMQKMQERFRNISPDRSKAVILAKQHLVDSVLDSISLGGINYTVPESDVQSLLSGITVGGYNVQEQQITLNQIQALKRLFYLVEQDAFECTIEVACALHAIAGRQESIELGKFRTGGVTIAGTDYQPPDANKLPGRFIKMMDEARRNSDLYDQAISVFLVMARTQFFHDINKRMGYFMMNGHLLANGFPAINLPARRKLEFNQLMLDFYNSNDQKPMNKFLRSCMDPKFISIMKKASIEQENNSGPSMK